MKKLSYLVLALLLLICVGLSGCSIVEINNTTDKSTYVTMNKEAEEATPSPNYQRGKRDMSSQNMLESIKASQIAPMLTLVISLMLLAHVFIRFLMEIEEPKKRYYIIDRIICIVLGIFMVCLFVFLVGIIVIVCT